MVDFRKPLFDPGTCAATPATLEPIEEARLKFIELLGRHVTTDWGDLCEHDCQSNEAALECGARNTILLSAYIATRDDNPRYPSQQPDKKWTSRCLLKSP
jgi:hypothetical protein